MQTLQHVNIQCCANLEELSILKILIYLYKIQFLKYPTLKSIQGLEHLTRIRQLHVDLFHKLRELESVRHWNTFQLSANSFQL